MRVTFATLAGAVAVVPVLLACAQAGAMGHDPNVITAPELARSRQSNAYEAIVHLRPEMLRARGSGSLMLFSSRRPSVAVDNELVGGIEVLRSIRVENVTRLEYVDTWKAAKRYGLNLQDGVVLVTKDTATTQLSVTP